MMCKAMVLGCYLDLPNLDVEVRWCVDRVRGTEARAFVS